MTTQPKTPLSGVFAPTLTPFDAKLEPDVPRFVAHCKWLVANGSGLAIFGTNSEANSQSVAERMRLMEALLAAGIPAAKMMPGTGACALPDAVALTKHAVEHGAGGVLMLPPFYYKGVSDDGLFAYYAEVIERVASDRLAIYLYHIPQVSQVPITLTLIERLLKRYPKAVAGAKDSSGIWDNTKAMLDNFAKDGFGVFPGSEMLLAKVLPLGGKGCISATVNVNPAGIVAACTNFASAQGAALQAAADKIRLIFQSVPTIAAMKWAAAQASGHADWAITRPPLVRLDDAKAAELAAALKAAGFEMAGYPRS
jgi:4-hydroxy-tetrahydrodipicolinate synthase